MADRDETTGRFLAGNRAGKKGGPARAARLSPERRREIARMGAAVVNARRAAAAAAAAAALEEGVPDGGDRAGDCPTE